MERLENEGERSLQLLQDGLDEIGERWLDRVLIVDVLGEDGDGFSVCLGFESVTTLFEDQLELAAVRHDSVVNDNELRIDI